MINRSIVIVGLALIVVFVAGCAHKSAEEQFIPIMGIVAEMDEDSSSFVLTTLPQSEGLPCGKTPVSYDVDTEIVDNDSNPTQTMKNYDTVTIEDGIKENGKIIAKTIRIRISAKVPTLDVSSQLTKTDLPPNEIPKLLLKQVSNKLPEDFPTSAWNTSYPEKHPTVEDAVITTMTNNEWMIYLISNPETEEIYSVTLTNSDDFIWKGAINKDNVVITD